MSNPTILFLAVACIAPAIAIADPGNYNQQAKLLGSGAVGNANQGSYVAVSADGNTALIGAPNDSGNSGAAFVFTRSNGIWTQQGPKLTGSGGNFGAAVALSGDGNTAAVGAPGCAGEVVIFVRVGGVWGQQANLIGTPTLSQCPHQGTDAALSGDGNTLIESALADQFLPPEQPTDCDTYHRDNRAAFPSERHGSSLDRMVCGPNRSNSRFHHQVRVEVMLDSPLLFPRTEILWRPTA